MLPHMEAAVHTGAGIFLAVAGIFLTAIAALSVRLLFGMVRRGPQVAEEAYERGDNLAGWWLASQTPTTLDSPRDHERLAFGGRMSHDFGEVLVEERASFPSYSR